jgi:hypothetical protein
MECSFCCQRLEHQLDNWKSQFPDYMVSVLFTSVGIGFVEFKFIDLEDDVSEWTYWFVHEFLEEERRELGSLLREPGTRCQ